MNLTMEEIFQLIVCGTSGADVLASPDSIHQMGIRYWFLSMALSAILNALSFVLIGLLGRGRETTFQGQYIRIRGAFAGDAVLAIIIIVSTSVEVITMTWMLHHFAYCFMKCFTTPLPGHTDMVRRPEYDQVLLRAGNPHDISVYDHIRYIWDEWKIDAGLQTVLVRFRCMFFPPRQRIYLDTWWRKKRKMWRANAVAMGRGKPHRHSLLSSTRPYCLPAFHSLLNDSPCILSCVSTVAHDHDCNNSPGIRHVSFPNQMFFLFLGLVYGLSDITSLKRLVPVAKFGNLMILTTLIWMTADFGVHGPTPFTPTFFAMGERGYAAHQRYSERGSPAHHLPPWKLMGRVASCTMSRGCSNEGLTKFPEKFHRYV